MKHRNEIQLLQKQVDDLKRERQTYHDLFVMAAVFIIIRDDTRLSEVKGLVSSLIQEELKNLRKLVQVTDERSSSYSGDMSVGP